MLDILHILDILISFNRAKAKAVAALQLAASRRRHVTYAPPAVSAGRDHGLGLGPPEPVSASRASRLVQARRTSQGYPPQPMRRVSSAGWPTRQPAPLELRAAGEGAGRYAPPRGSPAAASKPALPLATTYRTAAAIMPPTTCATI